MIPPRISSDVPALAHTGNFPTANPAAVTLVTEDGVPLGGTRWLASGVSRGVVLIAPATGVPHRFYMAFATWLAEQRFDVLCWDWRGIGESRLGIAMRDPRLSMHAWGELDLAAAIAWAGRRAATGSIYFVGHSFGGQALGLAPNAHLVDRAVLVGAQHGWMGHWPWPYRLPLTALWRVAMPALSVLLGRFPSRLFGLGEDLPGGVAREWSRWCARREHLGRWAGHRSLDLPMLSISFDDDHFAPRAAAAALVREYAKADIRHEHHPAEGLGHFGFFRRGLAMPHWERVAAFLGGAR